ncbi:SNF2-related protein [Dactylosporangium sp. AC04546]|uniref:SNF2-related protein n=1 Tax=Dactylosporangium sp. AC04546 TaxID=2862460 RepID=UPI002E7ABA72|nr:SNF2-related protein [Dactylosporangium sp. AC04546]WVK78206.1 SNF2-related protein [Dactylosporangium sp. AC04546]
MIVVHGLVNRDGRLACWAETTPPAGGTARRGRRTTPHPYAVVPPVPGELGTADLYLPSAASRPLPSPELAAAHPARGRPGAAAHPVRVLPWTIPTVTLAPGTDLEALLDTVAERDPATAPQRGGSVGWLADVVRYAADLVRRGRVVPVLLPGPAAAWHPVLWDADAARFESLWRAMPGIACATEPPPTATGVAGHGGARAVAATRAAVEAEVDARVRRRLAGRPLLAPGAVRTDSTVRSWLTALTTPDARLRAAGTSLLSATPDDVTAQPDGVTATDATPARPTLTTGAFIHPLGAGTTPALGTAAAPATDATHPAGAAAATGRATTTPGSATAAVGLGRVLAETADVARVREAVGAWVDSGRPAAVRLCFRLSHLGEELELPETDDEDDSGDGGAAPWYVEFLLQPAEEPSLVVPAERVWTDRASPLFKWVDYPQDVLLAGLGRASRLWPELDEALRARRPAGVEVDTAGAYRFLTHATLLEEAGFGVLLPARWQRRQDLGLTLTVHTRQPAEPVLKDVTADRAAVVRFRWGLALGDRFLSEADLKALATAKVPLVRLRGRWVHLDPDRLRAGLAFLERGGEGEMTVGEAMRLTRLVPDGDLPLPVTGVDGTGWLADLLTGRVPDRLELLDPPAGFAGTLRPYQRRGFSWLAFLDRVGVGALLADDMGLGKTVQVLALEAHTRAQGARPPTLIVCPLSVLGNWRREIERFTPGLQVAVHHGSERTLRRPEDAGADLVLTTYQVATRDADLLAATPWDRVVLDEAQHVKNATGVTAQAVRRIPARHRVALTGTPVENRLTELWSIADFLNPGILGPAGTFRARYSVPVERWSDAGAAARLRRATRPFLLRRVKTDRAVIADLPERFDRKQWCTLTPEQASLYRAVVDELFTRLREGRAGPRRKGLVLAAMTKLKQVCNHPAHLMGDGTALAGRSGKLARLEEILTAARDAGDRALVFTQFARFGHLLTPYLAERLGTDVAFLHGGTPKGARDAMVERFQQGDGPGVLLLSLKAGGTGLNLTAANHVVHVDRWWNPAAEQQATDRAFRIGQRRDVQVHTFVCIGTVEERVEHIMARKRTLAGVAVGAGEGWLTGLSTDDLRDLIALAPEAIDD